MAYFTKILGIIRNKISYSYYKFLVDFCPRIVIDKIWNNTMGRKVNWREPLDINEKIEWLICYGDTSKWTCLADKYKVRNYLREKGHESILPQLYGVWDDAFKIDFNSLPQRFVLKCNHDCGSIRIIDKNLGYDIKKLQKHLNSCLKTKFGYKTCEPHYNRIKPLIIAEEFLENESSYSMSLIDYKVWCFNGKPYSIFVIYDRHHDYMYTNLYDLDWNVHPEYSVFTSHLRDGKGRVPKPRNFKQMLSVAADLSQGFPEVRVDFYEINGKLYFGEMTFTSAAGRMDYFTKEYLTEMGKQIVLPNRKKWRF